MKSLRELQESFQRGILAGDDAILAEVKDSAKEGRQVLFGVYRNAYVARLAEVLGDDYEQLHAYLGDAGFAKLVKAYIDANPSDQRSARWFGRHLPDFVREQRHLRQACRACRDRRSGKGAGRRLRWARRRAAHDSMSWPGWRPRLWPPLIFVPHPTAIRLRFGTNAAEIWSALQERGRAAEAHRLPEPQAILVWRQDIMARFRPMQAEEAMMWDEAAQGHELRRALRDGGDLSAARTSAELRAATYLKGWVDMGTLAGFRTR